MEKSKVYFADMRVGGSDNLLKKLKRLIVAAGFDTIDFKNKFAAIKIHFGEPGNLSYLRPNYSKVLVDAVAERGGKAFLTDSNTLYVGGRKNALDHLNAAYQNGFNPFVTGCHVLIADGLKGTDEALIPVKNGEYVKEAKIGRAIADADVIISFAHFKMHELTGMGGALKNIGMGAGSRAGKMEMHSHGKPNVDPSLVRRLRAWPPQLRTQRHHDRGSQGDHPPRHLQPLRPLHRHLLLRRDLRGRERRL